MKIPCASELPVAQIEADVMSKYLAQLDVLAAGPICHDYRVSRVLKACDYFTDLAGRMRAEMANA